MNAGFPPPKLHKHVWNACFTALLPSDWHTFVMAAAQYRKASVTGCSVDWRKGF